MTGMKPVVFSVIALYALNLQAQQKPNALSFDIGFAANPDNVERVPFSTRWQVRADIPQAGRKYPVWISLGRQTHIYTMQGNGRLTFAQAGISMAGPEFARGRVTTGFSFGAGPEWATFRPKSDLTVLMPYQRGLNGIRITGEYRMLFQATPYLGISLSLRAESSLYRRDALYRSGLNIYPVIGFSIFSGKKHLHRR